MLLFYYVARADLRVAFGVYIDIIGTNGIYSGCVVFNADCHRVQDDFTVIENIGNCNC